MLAKPLTLAVRAPKRGAPLPAIAAGVVLALFIALPLSGSAQEPPWDIFTGNAFLDDLPVADGAVVEAWVRDVRVASNETIGSQYQIYIEQPPGEFFAGQFLKFTVNGYEVEPHHEWEACTQSQSALYAYTAPRRGDRNPDPDAVQAVRELEAKRAELERERFEMTGGHQRQVATEIANITNQWERAIEELRAETEREIQQIRRKFELERKQIPLGRNRETTVRKLERELASWVQERRTEFESESQLKRQHLRDDIIDIEQTNYFELQDVHQRIVQVENELHERMREIGVPFNYFQYTGDFLDECPRPPGNWEEDSISPGNPDPDRSSPEEPGPSRGFFTNSISANPNGLDKAMDPTALAVIGILITLAATAVQMVKGN